MSLKRISFVLVSVIAVGSMTAVPVFAETVSAAPTNLPLRTNAGTQDQRMTRIKDRADQEIDRRIKNLGRLMDRAHVMSKLSDTTKSTLENTVQSETDALTALKAKIDADTDITTLRTDVQSITKSYRIYALVIPQGAVLAAADRLTTVADTMSGIGDKLQSRIAEAQAAGKDVSAMQSSYDDLVAKLADAKTQAADAISATQALKPDNGDQAIGQANLQALKDARSKIHTGIQDLVAARKDAATVIAGFRSSHLDAKTSDSASGSMDQNGDHATGSDEMENHASDTGSTGSE